MRAYLQLLRPANIVTAFADILAGYAIAGLPRDAGLPWLLISSACIYAGGVVLNDYFDRDVDARERPERPIPSGRVSARSAAALGASVIAAGLGFAWAAGKCPAETAALLALVVIAYDVLAKRSGIIGPPTMGACRGLNLLLGMSAAPATQLDHAWIALVPFVYIWAVTALSRGEVSGGRRAVAALVFTAILAVIAVLGWIGSNVLPSELFVLLLAVRVLPPFWQAWRSPTPAAIRQAIRAGVLSLIVVDASLAAIHAGPFYGLIVLALLLVASGLARLFAVT